MRRRREWKRLDIERGRASNGALPPPLKLSGGDDQRAATRSLIALLLNHCFSAAAARRFVTSTVGRFGHCDFRSTAARGTPVDFTFLQSHCLCPPLSLRIPKERQVSPGRLGCRASLPTLVLIELRSFPAILAPAHRQVNARG